METVRLTDSLSADPTNPGARAALLAHLAELQGTAAELGFEHLEASLAAASDRLQRESFSPASVAAVRALAWRYEALAAMSKKSGTHAVVSDVQEAGQTLGSLVDEVTAEVRRGLLDAAQNGADASLDPGKGTEVLAPVWKAIADLRALVEERSGGAVRFDDTAGVPLLTLTGVGAPDALRDDVSLEGRRVLVADDDAEVRWFYVGALREAGARVVEATDGLQALELARNEAPDLILADIVMPRLDGLALCAAVRREPGLDGMPIILLSWRDDFLHRMRELRANAQDYLRKELPARQLLDRVASVLEPLTRFEESIRTGEEARGDLEALGVSALLRALRRLRPDARLVLQDAWNLFEVELSGGHIVDVTRTDIDGTVTQGSPTLLSLAGMPSGRFVVAESAAVDTDKASLEDDFEGAARRLSEMIAKLGDVPDCTVEFDSTVLGRYARHCPIGVQGMIARLVAGEPPSALWQSGEGSRAVVDGLLVTLARQGAVVKAVAPERPGLSESRSTANGEQKVTGAEDNEQSEQWTDDPLERENFRAQWAVSMHREPANRVSRFSETIWRHQADASLQDSEVGSGFEFEARWAPRVLGWSFALVFCATVGFLLWREGVRGSERVYTEAVPTPNDGAPTAEAVTSSVEAPEGQGVLELVGPEDVAVRIDGVEHGPLPVTLILEEGRHVVRYRIGESWTYRFYYVRAGAKRVLRVSPTPSGFVDAL